MREQLVTGQVRHWVEAKIIKADGTVVDLGTIASSDPDGPGTITVQAPSEKDRS